MSASTCRSAFLCSSLCSSHAPPVDWIELDWIDRLIDQVALKHLMEKVVPILTALKHVLERAHSPLLREIMFYFRELFRWAANRVVLPSTGRNFCIRTRKTSRGCLSILSDASTWFFVLRPPRNTGYISRGTCSFYV